MGDLAQKVFDQSGDKRYRKKFERRIYSEGVFVFGADSRDLFFKNELGSYDKAWLQHYSGKLPQRWVHWVNAHSDIEATDIPKIQLDEKLVDMLATYPHHLVVNTLGKHQKLSMRQLAIVSARVRSDIPEWNYEEIAQAQLLMGATKEFVDEAWKLGMEAPGNTATEMVFGLLGK